MEKELGKNEKVKLVEAACVGLEKEYGDGTIGRMGTKKIVPVQVIPTRIFGLDNKVLGCGGIPRARITEIFGPESSGKTTIALHAVAEAQRRGGLAAYVDAEHALDLKYAKALGVDVENMYLSQPDYGEQALNISQSLIETGAIDVLVIDSVAALVPKAELDGEMEDANVGLHARLMSKAMRKLAGAIRKNNVAVIFINQIREKIGVMFGSPETTTGGRALRFYASVRLDIRRIAAQKDGNEVVSNRTKIKAVKNKVGNPYRETEFDIVFGHGANAEGSLIEVASELGVIEKSGSWFSYKGERLGQGADKSAQTLKDNQKLFTQIENETKAKL